MIRHSHDELAVVGRRREAELRTDSTPMSSPSPSDPSGAGAGARPSGRYRYCAGRPLDPSEGVHPDLASAAAPASAASGVPASPAELIAMQNQPPASARPEKPERQPSAKVAEVMARIDQLDTSAAEDLQIVRQLVRRLECFHDEVVEELRSDDEASHAQLIAWAIDADRLMRSRLLLDSVDLE